MASVGGRGAAARKHLRVLLPFTCDSLRIPDELAEEIGAAEALILGPPGSGKEVWPVEVGQDGDGAFLGRGWQELAGACGVGPGWFLVVRHRGRGVLTIKGFDSSCCLWELGTPPAATLGSKGAPRRLQFISVLPLESLEKMLIPAKFVQRYIPKEHLNTCMTAVLRPLGKIGQIELKMDQSDLFVTGGWSQFLTSHGIIAANALLLRYEGKMLFTVKVFEPDGCQRESRNKDIRIQQDVEEQQPSDCSTRKCYRSGEKKPKGPMAHLNKPSLLTKAVYEIGPPSWIKKQIIANTLNKELALPRHFCDAIGLMESCTITLKTSVNSTEFWQVVSHPYKNKSYMFRQGWKRFCKENNLMEGDICTFKVVETTMWHVIITRYKEKINQPFYGTLSASSVKRKSKNDRSCSEEQKRPKGSMTSLNKASSTTCSFEMGPPSWIKETNASSMEMQFEESLPTSNWKHQSKSDRSSSEEQKKLKSYRSLSRASFEIGPPAWIKKEMNANTIERQFCLPLSFCKAIGLRELCTITLKTSMSSTTSWLVRVHHYLNCSMVLGSGWTCFCHENRISVGDVCTFQIIETTQWHVIIERPEASTR